MSVASVLQDGARVPKKLPNKSCSNASLPSRPMRHIWGRVSPSRAYVAESGDWLCDWLRQTGFTAAGSVEKLSKMARSRVAWSTGLVT